MKNSSLVVILCGLYLILSYAFDALMVVGMSTRTLANPDHAFLTQYVAQVFIPIAAGVLALIHKHLALWVLCPYIAIRPLTVAYWADDLSLFFFLIDWSYVLVSLLLWWKREYLKPLKLNQMNEEVTS